MTCPPASTDSSSAVGVTSYLSVLLSFVQAREWGKLEEFALSDHNAFYQISSFVSDCVEFNGMTLLHAVCRCDPPIELLVQMIELYPKALEGKDCMGRTPLQ